MIVHVITGMLYHVRVEFVVRYIPPNVQNGTQHVLYNVRTHVVIHVKYVMMVCVKVNVVTSTHRGVLHANAI